jgi:hypothetical protein
MRTSNEKEISKLRKAVEDARADRVTATAAAAAAQAKSDERIGDLAAQLGLGEITAEEYDRAKAQAQEPAERAATHLARVEATLEGLQGRGAEAAKAVRAERLAAASAQVAAREETVARLEAELDAEERKLAADRERGVAVDAETRALIAEFDEQAAEVHAAELRQRDETAEWWAQQHPERPDLWPADPVMRAAIEAAIGRLRAKAAVEKAKADEFARVHSVEAIRLRG